MPLSSSGNHPAHMIPRFGARIEKAGAIHLAVTIAIVLATLMAPVTGAHGGKCESANWISDVLGDVSGSEIINIVVGLESFGTRDFHTTSATEAANYIHGILSDMGISTHLQEFEVDGIVSANVVAVLNPELAEEGVYVIGAHYDSENSLVTNLSEAENITAPGADDNASGVGVMLEMARILSGLDCELPTVKFVAFGAEETGYDYSGGKSGSTEFAKSEVEAGVQCMGAFVLDMVGYRTTPQSRATIVSNSASDYLASSIVSTASELNLDIAFEIESNESIRYSDHSSFWIQGYPSVLMIEELSQPTLFPVNPYYHSSEDTSDKLSEEQMVVVTKALIGALLNLTGQGELSYTPAYYGVVAAAAIIVTIMILLLLLKRWKREI
ncbi:MAG: M28 family peptidase [Methanobacteriota archaeon]|nr:MAG: M28 family peptidase [Euryarchaeota archaeon]